MHSLIQIKEQNGSKVVSTREVYAKNDVNLKGRSTSID